MNKLNVKYQEVVKSQKKSLWFSVINALLLILPCCVKGNLKFFYSLFNAMNRISAFRAIIFALLIFHFCSDQAKGDNISLNQQIVAIDSLWTIDKYDEAISLLHKTLPMVIKINGKESMEYYQFMSMASQIYSDADNDKQALILIEDVINGIKKNLGTNNPIYAKALSNKGLYLINLGQAAKSIPVFGEASMIFRAYEPTLEYATCLKDLAIAYYDTGQYDKAKSSVSHANEILLASEATIIDAEYVSIKKAYIDLESEVGDCNASIVSSLQLLEELQANNIHIQQQSNILLSLVCSYLTVEDYSRAIEEGLKFIRFNEDNGLDDSKKDLGTVQYYIGLAYYSSSEFSKAKEYFLSSLKLREQTFGVSHPYTIGVLSWLVNTFSQLNDEDSVTVYLEQLFKRAKADFLTQFPRLDSKGQADYWKELNSDFFTNTLPNLCTKFANKSIYQIAYNGILMSKGILLESDVRFKHELRNNEDPSYFERYTQIEEARKNIDINTDSLDFEEQRLRMDFIKNSNYLDGFKTTWKDVRAALADNEVAIEFILSPIQKSNDLIYSAIIISNDWDSPRYINLFTKEELDNIDVEDFYNTNKLSSILWESILNQIGEAKVIYFSPIGELYNISIENLPLSIEDPTNRSSISYMSDKYLLIRLNSTRDITSKSLRNFVVSATLFGDMNYDGTNTSSNASIQLNNVKRGNDYRSGFRPLPGTKIELENINKALSSTGIEISTYDKDSGTKYSFLKLSGNSPSIIHVATHGYYNNTHESDISALDCSGLVFSGFNLYMDKNKKTTDGCITASEISQMDLYNTDLAVLSACETGLGKIESDGVFGLQRGFKMAGVNSLMMSLWEVDDDATQLLMTEFYRNYVNGMTKMDALLNAQKIVRATVGFEDPEYWAAFILLDALN